MGRLQALTHTLNAVMTLGFVQKVERKAANVPKMTVRYWRSGLESYLFVCTGLKAPDTERRVKQSAPRGCTHRSPRGCLLPIVLLESPLLLHTAATVGTFRAPCIHLLGKPRLWRACLALAARAGRPSAPGEQGPSLAEICTSSNYKHQKEC